MRFLVTRKSPGERDARRDERSEEIRARRLRELAALLEDIKAPRCPCGASQRR